MASAFSAASTTAVLPRPWRCSAGPAAAAVWRRISPRMYDSVKRLEPTINAPPVLAEGADAGASASARGTALIWSAARAASAANSTAAVAANASETSRRLAADRQASLMRNPLQLQKEGYRRMAAARKHGLRENAAFAYQ